MWFFNLVLQNMKIFISPAFLDNTLLICPPCKSGYNSASLSPANLIGATVANARARKTLFNVLVMPSSGWNIIWAAVI